MKNFALLCALGLTAALGAAEADRLYQDAQARTDAVQTWYRRGVPHTDRQGNRRTEYDPEKSFFPIAVWGVPRHEAGGEYDWALLRELNVNTVWPYPNTPRDLALLEDGEAHDLQVILMHDIDFDELEKIKDHPRLLANVWMDEPIGRLEIPGEMEKLYAAFSEYKAKANAIAPSMAVFINDAPWIMPPATEWFVRWNTAGDVACHDNYPVKLSSANTRSIACQPNGMPQSIALTALANDQAKPVWVIVGAFDQGYPAPGEDDRFPYRFATPDQLRAQVYTSLIHGATGIHYFIWDSYISRDGSVYGISPDPRRKPAHFIEDSPRSRKATPMQQVMMRALWDAAGRINAELRELTPALLSPTAETAYGVTAEFVAGDTATPNPVRTLLKTLPDSDDLILLACNQDAATFDVTIEFDEPLSGVEVLFDSYLHEVELSGDGASFRMRFEPFQAHVIRIER